MSPSLPDPHSFITSMISQLVTIVPPSVVGLPSLRRQDLQAAKSIFTTLHFLFPHELLPALDILDRKLVSQLAFIPPSQNAPASPTQQPHGVSTVTEQKPWEIFYVQSASATASSSKGTSRYRRVYNPTGTYYEVRLDAWNCTCPAFAFSAFGPAFDVRYDQAGSEDERDQIDVEAEGVQNEWRFGGTATRHGTGAPICKHILAAMLGKALPGLFGYGVEKKEVTAAELSGWAGGWGE